MLIRASILLFLFSYQASLSYAGLFGDSKAREEIETVKTQMEGMEARVVQIEAMIKSQALLELYQKIETQESELGEIRGQLELLKNQNELLQKRQRDFYIDLDSRLRQIENPNAPPAVEPSNFLGDTEETSSLDLAPAAPTVVTRIEPATPIENSAYNEAYSKFRNGDYRTAISQFETFLVNHPSSSLAPAAAYWVGNAYYALRDFQQAIDAQNKLIATYPNSDKVPDALLNIASSQLEMVNRTTAKATLEDLITKYPFSDAAEKAKHRLASL